MPIRPPVTVVRSHGEIVKQDALRRRIAIRRAARHHDDTPLLGNVQACEKSIDENEVSKMIDREVFLDAIDQLAFVPAAEISRIADQHVDRRPQRQDIVRASSDRVEIAEIELHRRRHTDYLPTGFLRAFERTARADDVRAAFRQDTHGFKADARRAARHDSHAARKVQARGDLFGRRVLIETADRHTRGWHAVGSTAGRQSGNQ